MGKTLSDKPLSETLRDFGPTNLIEKHSGFKAGANLARLSKS